jgi:uncharacterized protein YbbC (DUF1343 family)/CubicO group peptidase (beta-lactamase class C family)
LVTLLLLLTAPLARAQNAEGAFEKDLGATLDALIDQAILKEQVPGAVLLVLKDHEVIYRKARGLRVAGDKTQPLKVDTIFDLASLTKCVATATSIVALIDRGALRLDTRLREVLLDAEPHPAGAITMEQLLRHRSGLAAANSMADFRNGLPAARERILTSKLKFRPGTDYLYSDLGFIVLGWVIEAVTKQPLDQASQDLVFEPLSLAETGFRRCSTEGDGPEALRFAPTEAAGEGMPDLCGVVHDPRSRAMDGVAGHAGLFSTIDDLGSYTSFLLRRGKSESGDSIISEDSIRSMVEPTELAAVVDRGMGFDRRRLGSRSVGPRGKHFGPSSFGHTGFTGTSVWIDPTTNVAIVLLTSRLQGKNGSANELRERVATVVASKLKERPWMLAGESPAAAVRTGLDRVAAGSWPKALRGARIGVITNHTGRDRDGVSTIDRLNDLPDVKLVRIFAPEHGIRGTEDKTIDDEVDAKTGLPVLSLYGKTRVPTKASLADLDALVFDIQDIGTRFYTYVSTMVNCMSAAADAGIAFVVLDRPNPIGGLSFEGPLTDQDQLDFVGRLVMPLRHGMTVGELANMAKDDLKLKLNLHVVWMTGWRRSQWWDQTGLPWVNPSPNMRNLNAAALYPGIGLLETTNVSVGRGTATPFEIFGAPWIDGNALAQHLRQLSITGVRVTPTEFTPKESKHANLRCSGVFLEVTDRRQLDSLRLGLSIATWLRSHCTDDWDTRSLNRLLKHRSSNDAILQGTPVNAIIDAWRLDVEAFRLRRERYLLYDN